MNWLTSWPFWLYLILFEVPIIAAGWRAYSEGWLWPWQAAQHVQTGEKFFSYAGHGGVWGLFIFGAPITAHVVEAYGVQWNGAMVIAVFMAVNIFGLGLLYGWVADPVKSSMARDGMLPIPGALNYLSMTVTITIAVMYYLGTAKVDKEEIWLITGMLAVSTALGMLQPPYAVHGSIHGQAWLVTGAGCALLAVGALYLRYLH